MASVPTVLQNSAWSRLGAMAQRYSSAAELRRCVLRRVRRIHPTGFSRFHVYFAGKNGWKCLEGLRVPTFLVVTETPGTCADLSKANGRFPGHLSRSALGVTKTAVFSTKGPLLEISVRNGRSVKKRRDHNMIVKLCFHGFSCIFLVHCQVCWKVDLIATTMSGQALTHRSDYGSAWFHKKLRAVSKSITEENILKPSLWRDIHIFMGKDGKGWQETLENPWKSM